MELDPSKNPLSPLILHHNDNPATAIALDLLDGTNFIEWSVAVKRGLSVKNKLALIDGSVRKPTADDDPAVLAAWTRANNLVL